VRPDTGYRRGLARPRVCGRACPRRVQDTVRPDTLCGVWERRVFVARQPARMGLAGGIDNRLVAPSTALWHPQPRRCGWGCSPTAAWPESHPQTSLRSFEGATERTLRGTLRGQAPRRQTAPPSEPVPFGASPLRSQPLQSQSPLGLPELTLDKRRQPGTGESGKPEAKRRAATRSLG
jgi:hypothetical protein